MHQKIIAYIKRNSPISYDALNQRAVERGHNLAEFDYAMERVHRDKRIKVTSELLYTYQEPKVKAPGSHLTWLRKNYVPMTPENDGSGIDLDLSWMFLKTKEERDEYKALASGKPLYMVKSKRVHTRG